jgi:hypothetical protein
MPLCRGARGRRTGLGPERCAIPSPDHAGIAQRSTENRAEINDAKIYNAKIYADCHAVDHVC